MPKDFKGQDLRGRNFKNQDLRGADFSGADIRGAKFTGANLAEAKFTGARAGVRKRWMVLPCCISFVLCSLLDFVGILAAVVFTAFLLSPNFPQAGVLPHIEMLLIQAVIYLALACQGFTAKALTTITILVTVVLAGASAGALVFAGARGVDVGVVGVVGAAAVAGTGAVAFAGALALALAPALALTGAVTSAGVFVLAFALAFVFAPADAIARSIAGAGYSAGALADARAIASAFALAALLLSLYVVWRSSKEDEKFEHAHSLGLWLGVLGGTSFKTADLSDADFSDATLSNCDFSGAIVTRTGFKDAKQLQRARLKDTILHDKAVRDLLVTGQGHLQCYRGKNLQGANLAGAYLGGVDFTEADLSGAFLKNADLTGAILELADLRGALLENCDLRRASLVDANLANANLTAAHLQEADLRGAILFGSLLNQVNFENTILGGTTFANVDLSSAQGLESCKHEGPSSLDYATLSKSVTIPQTFLLATGLPQILIEYLQVLVERPAQYYSCFISYSHRDEHFARRLYADLQELGIRTWFAPHDLRVGNRIQDQLDAAIRVHDKLVLILSRESTRSQWVQYEVKKALDTEHKTHRTVLFPVSLDDSIFQTSATWATRLKQRFILDFSRWKDEDTYRLSLSRLAKALTLTAASEMSEGT